MTEPTLDEAVAGPLASELPIFESSEVLGVAETRLVPLAAVKITPSEEPVAEVSTMAVVLVFDKVSKDVEVLGGMTLNIEEPSKESVDVGRPVPVAGAVTLSDDATERLCDPLTRLEEVGTTVGPTDAVLGIELLLEDPVATPFASCPSVLVRDTELDGD